MATVYLALYKGTGGSLYDRFSVRQSDYPSAEGYLEGIDVVCESFFTLLPKYKNDPKALFVLDPPYLCTQQASYNCELQLRKLL
ncbi:Uncharacterised protein [[Pasteurella] mairii]|uniref:Uncharacterized protein n=1 Tax=[Pasteurella] mairii TaxID=757 RepID=A0A379B430_9PAST|nr:Uncharacterised protein [[Pasteurella] mairii]